MSNVPHGLAGLLLDLAAAKVELARHPGEPGRVRHRPADLPPDLAARLRLYRAAVAALLERGYLPEPGGEAAYVYHERLGIADELAMPTHAGSPAWLVAVGESIVAGEQYLRSKKYRGTV